MKSTVRKKWKNFKNRVIVDYMTQKYINPTVAHSDDTKSFSKYLLAI